MCVLVGLLNLAASLDVPEAWRQLEPWFDPLCGIACAELPPHADDAALSAAWGGALSAAWDGSWDGSAMTARPAVREVPPPPSAALASAAAPAAAAATAPAAARNCSAWCDTQSP